MTDSGPGTGCKSGADPGHIGICVCPTVGCQTLVAAWPLAPQAIRQAAINASFIAFLRCDDWPGLLDQNGDSGVLHLTDPAGHIGRRAAAVMAFFGQSAARVDRLCVSSTENAASSQSCARDGAEICRHLILTLQASPTVTFQISNRHIEAPRINILHIDRTDGYKQVSFFNEIDIAGHFGKAVR